MFFSVTAEDSPMLENRRIWAVCPSSGQKRGGSSPRTTLNNPAKVSPSFPRTRQTESCRTNLYCPQLNGVSIGRALLGLFLCLHPAGGGSCAAPCLSPLSPPWKVLPGKFSGASLTCLPLTGTTRHIRCQQTHQAPAADAEIWRCWAAGGSVQDSAKAVVKIVSHRQAV